MFRPTVRIRWPYPLAALAALLCLAACEDDAVAPIDLGPTGTPTLALTLPMKTPGAERVCASIGHDANARVPILVEVEELVLRPPGACGDFVQCGHLALYTSSPSRIDGELQPASFVLNNEGAVPAIDLLMRKLANRYHDGKEDALTIRVDVLNEAGELIVIPDNPDTERVDESKLNELTLCTAADCEALPTCGDGEKDPCEVCDPGDAPCCLPTCQGWITDCCSSEEEGTVCGSDPDGEGCAVAPICQGADSERSCTPQSEPDDTECVDDEKAEGICCKAVCKADGEMCS
jgi:hypothetical protein